VGYPEREKTLFKEDFSTLDNWDPLYFPKIKRHSSYKIVSAGTEQYLKAESNASASALVYKKRFNVYEFPYIRWRWKTENVYKNGNAKRKKGDDYPIRIYVIFKYDPGRAGFFEKLKYNSAKLVYGEYPPHSALNYIWANKEHKERIITSAYTAKSKLLILEKGVSKTGKWQEEEVDLVTDYELAFGKKPPAIASLAIMNDSDNTDEQSVSYVDYIEIYRKETGR
jgi:hypothetical protein